VVRLSVFRSLHFSVKYLVTTSFISLMLNFNSAAQLLEPRLLTNLPIGTNFIAAGYSYETGRLLLDPAQPIDDDLTGQIHGGFIGYVRSLRLFNESGKFGLTVPFASGNWNVSTQGSDSTRHQTGLGDIGLRFSYNFTGSPAIKPEEFSNYKQKVISGMSFQVILPTGAYDNSKLINLGSNRIRFRTVVGTSIKHGTWIYEFYGTLRIILANNDFLEGNRLTQRPVGAIKFHVIKTLPKGIWITLDTGYGFGGRSYLNGEPMDVRFSTFRFGITLAIPIGKKHSLKLAGYIGRSLEQGPDFNGFITAYQYRWFDRQ
jgi:hypothetical protein